MAMNTLAAEDTVRLFSLVHFELPLHAVHTRERQECLHLVHITGLVSLSLQCPELMKLSSAYALLPAHGRWLSKKYTPQLNCEVNVAFT